MRRFLTGFVVFATTALVPMFAWAGNQEAANRIAKSLRQSGRMSDYRIAVKVQDGTAWLHGRVTSPDQINKAMNIAFRTPGVERVVNELSIAPTKITPAKKRPPSKIPYPPRSNAMSAVQPVSAQQPRELPLKRVASTGWQRPLAQTVAMPADAPPRPMYTAAAQGGAAPVRYDQPCLPNYAWPSYAAYPNYAALTYPKQHSPSAWPYIGPFYPYPQVPLEWRKVTLEWDDGWWFLDFKDEPSCCWHR